MSTRQGYSAHRLPSLTPPSFSPANDEVARTSARSITAAHRNEYHRRMFAWCNAHLDTSDMSTADCINAFTQHLSTLGHTPESYTRSIKLPS